MALEDIQKERLKKLENIKSLGIDPYPASAKRNQTIGQALDMLGQQVAVAGRLKSLRPHGKITFADLEDESGKIQLLFSQTDLPATTHTLLANLDLGDFIAAQGEVIKTQAGQITVSVKDYQLLTKSTRQLPSSWYGFKDVEEKLRKRYLDLLLNPEVREMFKLKSKFWANMRNFMLKHDFLEVEMPVLEPIPGGADARPFITHHNALDIDLYLRISLELPLKRLLVGGYEKVFEIGRVFRNEGIDAEHLQDYTQIEFYWAYADYNQLMDFVQDMYQTIIQETFGTLKTNWQGQEIDWSGNWPRVEYTDLLNKEWGVDIDKMTVEDLYELAKKLKVPVEPNLGKGRLLDYIYKKTIRPHLIQPMYVLNHPVEVEPLAKRLPSDPSKVQRMQILAMGSELGKGFSELNDPIDQRERFNDQMKLRAAGDEEAQMMDEDYVEAMEYGMPPNAGFGISERLFSMLVDKPMRETIFFPTMKPSSPVTPASSSVIPAKAGIQKTDLSNGSPIRSGMTVSSQDFSQKIVAVLNKDEEKWKIMNALGHIGAYLGNKMDSDFDTGEHFITKDGEKHPRNSQYPIIALESTNKQLIELMKKVRESGLLYIGYIPEMTETTNDEQLEKIMGNKNDEEIEYLGIGIFGSVEEVDKLTKKFSLFK